LESIYVWQFQEFTPGGGGTFGGNNMVRNWVPFLTNVKDPAGKSGMVITDSMGRGVGSVRPSNYVLYDIWADNWNNDMRNSVNNIRRSFIYTNPSSTYFGKPVEPKTSQEDTLRNIYPIIRKVEGKPWENNNTTGRTTKDVMVYRLAETYLLRAEAYFRKGDSKDAADDINAVRARAKASPVLPANVSFDYILDERARELITEEARRQTLTRMGKLVERVRKYNMMEITRASIQDRNEFFPIPQSVIDANFSAKLEQNKGY
ncbi:MAG: RagB/SusD family nutrient uptake outer membrane protein, partial [Ferruginibacter sp.]